jgi:hypothetical protein
MEKQFSQAELREAIQLARATNKTEKTFSNGRHDFWVRTETDAAGDTKKIYGIIPKDTEYDGSGYFNPSPILEVKGYSPTDFDKYFTEK